MHGAGSAIDRVINPPTGPARRFGGVIDAAFTLAIGSVCAFGLTLGPAPFNTVAVSSAAAASFSDQLNPASALLPASTPALAVSVLEAYRVAAGLGEFVSADACEQSAVHAEVAVTASGSLPSGIGKKSLAPDPAYATVSGEPGSLSVTIHACR